MNRERIACFVDGFNLYHALREIKKPYLKWLDLSQLMERLFPHQHSQIITDIFFFSAYPTWKKDSYERHRKYVSALRASGVQPILGQFKIKQRKCPNCKHGWRGHEEKESDVNIALALLNEAYRDRYDRAVIVSRDSDLAPATRMVRKYFPEKTITILS
ncbi:MAG: 6-hydroxy-3-succinoylpyridine 3-monooxygenase HspA, partial [Chlamydiae bacterium]|nr:6-hydroxy-3-succinoylpyridine 3-monooxygenase HspA [Chlamydiota bacterium]